MNYKLLAARFKKSFVSRKTKYLVAALLIATSSAFAQVPSYVPTNGLVGWWPFNGNANDVSGNSYNGTIINGTQGTIQNGLDRNSNLNSALFFNNAAAWNADGAYIELPSTIPNLFSSDFTISFWAKPTNPNTPCEMINKGRDNSGAFWNRMAGSEFQTGYNNNIKFLYYPVLFNNWNLFVITKRGNSLYRYINGNVIDFGAYSSPINLSPNFWIGKHNEQGTGNGSTYPFIGYIDDIGFWNRSLSQEEVNGIFKSNTCNLGTITSDGTTTFCAGNYVNLTFNSVCANSIDSLNMVQNGWSFFKKFNNKEYWIYSTRLDYLTAKQKCNQFGGDVICVNNILENDSVATPLCQTQVYGDFWIGLHQDLSSTSYTEPSGGWIWDDGSVLSYTNWDVGAPSNVGFTNVPSAENAVMDYSNRGSKWIDIGFGSIGSVVLEREINNTNCGTYQWKKNGVNITTNGTSRTYKATATGSYTCVATCNGTALTSNAIQVTTKTNAFASVTASGATSFCLGDSVTLNCTNLGSNYSVQWYRTNISMENATNYSLVVKQPGTYKVVTKNLTTGCSRISGSAITTSVNCRIAGDITSGTTTEENTTNESRLIDNELSQGVHIYPNPNNGSFNFTYEGEETGDGILQIINTMGQSIYSSAVTIQEGGYTQEIQLGDNYNKGFYIVRLLINGSYHDSRVMVR